MANTYAKTLYNEAKQACLELGLSPNLGSSRRLLRSGKTAVKGLKNYTLRKDEKDISKKPYTNEFGEQEPFGMICDRNLEYAEDFVQKNMAKFEGGVKNMTEASFLIMQKQRQKIKSLMEKEQNLL